jgi:hypothetical protein
MSLTEPSKDSSTQTSRSDISRKRPTSERRIQANRRNAIRSTGPKTERGKRTVAGNALKHGILAREVLIAAGEGKESSGAFHALVKQLCEYYEPVGVVEELLVQTIATCWWRQARVIRAENGEIRGRLDTLAVDRALRNSDKANLNLALSAIGLGFYTVENSADQKVSSMDRWSAMQAAQTDLRGHRSSLEYLTAILENAKSQISDVGYLSEDSRHRILDAFCFWDCVFALTCEYSIPLKPETKDGSPEKVVEGQADKKRAVLVAMIEDRLGRIRDFKGYAKERENLALDGEGRSFSLPQADATDKILRYEAHLDRKLYRAMDQLERLQRWRRGENVPPPLNINLGGRK